jgi:dTDP-4-amino-4,6-dideoxygalactose transaminase
MQVPLLELRTQYATISNEVRRAIDEVCDAQLFVLPAEVEAAEKSVAVCSVCAYGSGLSVGTDALLVALRPYAQPAVTTGGLSVS